MVGRRLRQAIEFARNAQSFLLRDMWAYDTRGKRRMFTWAVRLLKMSFLVYKNLMEKRFFLRAHELTYWTLISIVPLLAVLAVALKGLGQTDLADERFWPQVEKLIAPVAPAGRMMLSATKGDANGDDAAAPKRIEATPADAKADTPDGAGPEAAADAAQADDTSAEDAKMLVAKVRGFVEGLNTKAMGVAGFTIALLTVISLLSKIEQGFNDVWGIRRKRTFVTRFVVYWGVVSLPALMIVISSGYNVMAKGEKLFHQVYEVPVIGGLTRVLLPYVWVWLAFALLYTIMPNARVRWRSAVVAALVAGTLWHLMNQGYGMYFTWMATSEKFALYRVLYGSLAAGPFFLLWVWLSWAIVLFGCGVAYADQNLAVFEREGVTLRTSFGDRMFAALRCLVGLGQAFHFDRRPLTTRSIYVTLRLPPSIVYDCLRELKALGYITEIVAEEDDDSIAYQPASSLENYKLFDVIHTMHHHGGRHFPIPDDKAKEALNDAMARIWGVTERELADVTIHDVVLQAGPLAVTETTTLEDEVEALRQAEEELQEEQEQEAKESSAGG